MCHLPRTTIRSQTKLRSLCPVSNKDNDKSANIKAKQANKMKYEKCLTYISPFMLQDGNSTFLGIELNNLSLHRPRWIVLKTSSLSLFLHLHEIEKQRSPGCDTSPIPYS